MRKNALVILLAGSLCAPASPVRADTRGQVLHEKVIVGTLHCTDGICRSAESGETGPAKAIEQDGQLLYSPSGDAQLKPGEQVFEPQPDKPNEVGGTTGHPPPGGDRAPDRRDAIRSDRDTGPEGADAHIYHAVFNPEPFPYKRMTALDAVRIAPCSDGRPNCDDEVLEVFDHTRRPVAVLGPLDAEDRDSFWGSIVVDLEPGRWVPIPSVAPESRILQLSTEPRVDVELAKDGADNYFVRSPSGGRHRLNWLSDAPKRYFGGELPAGVRLSDEPKTMTRQVPERLRRRVAEVLAHMHLQITRSMPLERVLDPLVAYFRAFEVGTLPPPTGSSYLDLAMAQKGCCRHRSFAFAITAMALGIPVRYVENEVHVYVEVFVPKLGWRRINLGGAPLNEEILGGEGKSTYQEKGGDPFPQPPAFLKDAAPPPKGLPQGGKREPGSSGSGGSGSGGNGGAGTNGDGIRTAGGIASDENGGASSDGMGGRRAIGPPLLDLDSLERAEAAREAASVRAQPRARTHISVEVGERNPFRGETVEVSGQVSADGSDGSGLPVEIFLEAPNGAVRVAEATTTADGGFRVTLEIPKDLPLGDHRVVARTRGDQRRAASSTRRH
jgi:hypothetical protein